MYLLAASGRLDAAGLFIDIAAEAAAGRFNTRPLEELPFSGSNCFEAALALAFAFALRGLPLSASNCFEEVPLAFAFALHLPFGLALCSPADSRGGGVVRELRDFLQNHGGLEPLLMAKACK